MPLIGRPPDPHPHRGRFLCLGETVEMTGGSLPLSTWWRGGRGVRPSPDFSPAHRLGPRTSAAQANGGMLDGEGLGAGPEEYDA